MSGGWHYYLDFKDETFELRDGEQAAGRSRTCDGISVAQTITTSCWLLVTS